MQSRARDMMIVMVEIHAACMRKNEEDETVQVCFREGGWLAYEKR